MNQTQPQAPTTAEQMPNPEDLNYQIMPPATGYKPEIAAAPSVAPKPPQTHERPIPLQPEHEETGHKRKYILYIISAVVVIAAVGVGAYILLGKDKAPSPSGNTPVESRLPKAKLMEFFSVEACLDANVCGDEADPDDDGLGNYKEFIAGTKLTTSDTDGDGLADGDEVNIFQTDPTNKYTDPREIAKTNDYNDGVGFVSGYDPTTPGLKISETRKIKINEDITRLGLNEPSITTLKTNASGIIVPQSTSETTPSTINIEVKTGLASITLNVNDSIKWVNKTSGNIQIASDPHPAHTDLPELDSKILAPDQSYTFMFSKAGSYKYHNHLSPTQTGTITVK